MSVCSIDIGAALLPPYEKCPFIDSNLAHDFFELLEHSTFCAILQRFKSGLLQNNSGKKEESETYLEK